MKADPSFAAVILAAGASSRMGRPKPLLRIGEETFLDHVIACFSGISYPIRVVLGYAADEIRAGIARASEVDFVINQEPSRGMLSSLKCGLSGLPDSVDGAFFMPVDMPQLRRSTVEILAAEPGSLIVPVHDDFHGHPIRISRQIIADILKLPQYGQARHAIRRHQATYVPVDDPGILHDVDTPAEYEALSGSAAEEK